MMDNVYRVGMLFRVGRAKGRHSNRSIQLQQTISGNGVLWSFLNAIKRRERLVKREGLCWLGVIDPFSPREKKSVDYIMDPSQE